MGAETIISTLGIIALVVFVFSMITLIIKNYRIADSNQVLVVTGKVTGNKSAKTIHGGATFVWPIFQKYTYLDLSPMQIDIDLQNALSQQNIRISVPSSFTIAIGSTADLMGAAAERLLNKNNSDIAAMARDIIFGQLRATIADMTIEDINKDRDKFITNVRNNVEIELNKVGLIVINVNITDITDESGYLKALGQKAASEAINQAKVDVAEKDKFGAIGEANAKQEERIQVAKANSTAVQGENEAEREIAESNAELAVKKEEYTKKETSARLVNKARAEKEGYDANAIAQNARALEEEAKLKADIIVPAEIAKKELVIKAQANKEQDILKGEAEGEAEKAKQEGIAAGIQAILDAKAEGFKNIIEAAGSAEAAAQLMIIEQLPELTRIQVDAIKNVKIDSITVWEQGGSNGQGGSTSNFLNSMVEFTPPIQALLEKSGLSLPGWLSQKENKDQAIEAETSETSETNTEIKGDAKNNKTES